MWGDDIKSLRSNNQVFDWYVYFDATLVCREHILALAAGLHSMNPTWSSSSSTVSHSKQQKKSSAVCHLVFLSSPLLSVTSSLYPPRHPTALPEFCWDHRYGESGDNAEEKNKKRLTCAGLISHNPPTLEPAVSSYSPPPLFFSVFCISHNFVLLLSFCHSPQFLLHHAPLTLVSFLCAVLGNDCVQQRYCTMSCNATLLLFPRTWCGGSRACEQTRTCIPAHRHTERVM